ncbi:hypothetical protein D3C85_1817070 [compost metagenome]
MVGGQAHKLVFTDHATQFGCQCQQIAVLFFSQARCFFEVEIDAIKINRTGFLVGAHIAGTVPFEHQTLTFHL